MSLDAYAVHPRDGHTEIELKWTARRKPAADYDVFVHVLAPSGATAFQLDHPLKNGAGQMTSAWAASDSVNDQFVGAPPTGQNPGNYALRLGVYVPSPIKILQITRSGFPQPKDGWNDHAVLIENVGCK